MVEVCCSLYSSKLHNFLMQCLRSFVVNQTTCVFGVGENDIKLYYNTKEYFIGLVEVWLKSCNSIWTLRSLHRSCSHPQLLQTLILHEAQQKSMWKFLQKSRQTRFIDKTKGSLTAWSLSTSCWFSKQLFVSNHESKSYNNNMWINHSIIWKDTFNVKDYNANDEICQATLWLNKMIF